MHGRFVHASWFVLALLAAWPSGVRRVPAAFADTDGTFRWQTSMSQCGPYQQFLVARGPGDQPPPDARWRPLPSLGTHGSGSPISAHAGYVAGTDGLLLAPTGMGPAGEPRPLAGA